MTRRAQAGFSLVVAMIVLAIGTLMVAGAMVFTSSDRSAAASLSRSERMSACANAARNMFLAQVRVLTGNIPNVQMDQTTADGRMSLQTRHYGGAVKELTVKELAKHSVGGNSSNAYDLSNRVGSPSLLAGSYQITAVCKDTDNTNTNVEQEVEFVLRVGL